MSRITIDRAVLKQALEALDSCNSSEGLKGPQQYFDERAVYPALNALREALNVPQPFDLNEALNKELFDTAARQAREIRKEHRAKWGVECPECKRFRPKTNASILLPAQRCKVDGYRDPRPRGIDDGVLELEP